LRRLAFINAKGGVAKTTSCVNIGAGLALGGYRILLVDLDSQGQITKSLGVQAGDGWAACLSGRCLRPDDPAQRGRVGSHPHTTFNERGEVVDEDEVGDVTDLPVETEYVDERGRLLSLARDELGNTFEWVTDDKSGTLGARIIQAAD
jgi:cellulose biosynthesis protein BcsQ